MKNIRFFFLFSILLSCFCFFSCDSPSSYDFNDNHTYIPTPSPKPNKPKKWTGGTFSSSITGDKISFYSGSFICSIKANNQKVYSGSYTVSGDNITLTIEWAVNPQLIGMEQNFRIIDENSIQNTVTYMFYRK